MKQIYLASSYGRKDLTEGLAKELRSMGYGIVSGWHSAASVDEMKLDAAARADLWGANLSDLSGADALLVVSIRGNPRTTWAELGLGVVAGKRCIVVVDGDMDALPLVAYAEGVTRVRDVAAAVALLRGLS